MMNEQFQEKRSKSNVEVRLQIWGGPPKKQNLFIKNCVFILTCLNFSNLQSTLHWMQYTYWDIFSTAQNSFWTRWFWCLLVLLRFLVLPLPHQQNVSLWGSFSLGKQRSFGARSGEYGEWGMGFMPFLVKKCLTLSVVWAGALINHPSGNPFKQSSKKFTEADCSLSQQHQLVHWYRCVPRTLT